MIGSRRGGLRFDAATLVQLALISSLFTLGCSLGPRPSILLITVDTLRADHLGSYGFALESSPNMDALAEQSAVFERAVAASSRTVPSHATMMTSRWVRNHTVGAQNGNSRLAESERTLAVILTEAGWQTAAFISNVMLDRRHGLDVGFSEYDDELDEHEVNRETAAERGAKSTTDRALAWLRSEPRDPFFLWVHYNDPHGPYDPPSEYDVFAVSAAEDEPDLPVNRNQFGYRGLPAYQALEGLSKPSEYQSRYVGEIYATDAELSRLLAAAEEAAAPGALVVLLTSDHGESMGEEEVYFGHGHATTPDTAHVPFLLRAPGIAHQRRREVVHHVDVLPTLLEIAGLSAPPDVSGVALGPALRGEHDLPERTVFSDIGSQVTAYRGDRLLRNHFGATMGSVTKQSWQSFRWLDGARFEPAAEDEDLRAELMEHLTEQPPILNVGMDPEKKELLRALGYLPPRRPGPRQPR